MMNERGTLAENEFHPAAKDAMRYILSLGIEKLMMYQECFSSCAIEGNRLAEICSETLRRLLAHEPVGERYIMGLAWTIRNMEEIQE